MFQNYKKLNACPIAILSSISKDKGNVKLYFSSVSTKLSLLLNKFYAVSISCLKKSIVMNTNTINTIQAKPSIN